MKLQTLFEMSSRPCKINRTGIPVRAASAQEIPRGQFILQGRELIFPDTASFAQRIAFLFCSGTNALLYISPIFHERTCPCGYPKHHNMGSYRDKATCVVTVWLRAFRHPTHGSHRARTSCVSIRPLTILCKIGKKLSFITLH